MNSPTNTVGVRELKARLSEWLRRVDAGERVTITDRGRAIATLEPIAARPVPAWLRAMIAEGLATWGGGKPIGLSPRIPARGKLASTMVIEDRE